MSKKVDSQIVEMKFDNSNFEKNVQTSMNTIDKLKDSLKFDGVEKNFDAIDQSAKKVSFNPLASGIETVKTKFSALEVMGVTALANITNSAVNAGKRIVKALSVDQIKTGFNEYELKLNSIKTIMASTGEDLSVVNKYLQELNKYSDRTIYSFSDMTQNIGKFTNAGVKLEDAVAAIKGVSNEAAVSGANANEASRAMYNFAQALSAGYVKLIDWKSIENANMATVEFKNELLKTAKAVGTVSETTDGMYKVLSRNNKGGTMDEAISATKNFNDSLSYQWMTTDVLVKTLRNYADETTEIGKKAYAAAQDIYTISQLYDTLKESVQSGWGTTWETIVGDSQEAKKLLTSISVVVSGYLDTISDQRNFILKQWKAMGGRGQAITAFSNLLKKLGSIVKSVSEAFRNIFPKTTGLQLFRLTNGFLKFTQQLEITEPFLDKLTRTFQGLFSVLGIATTIIKKAVKGFASLFSSIKLDDNALLSATANVGDWLTALHKTVEESTIIERAFAAIKYALDHLSEAFQNAKEKVLEWIEQIKQLPEVQAAFEWLTIVKDKVRDFTDSVSKGFGSFVSDIFSMVKNNELSWEKINESFTTNIDPIIKYVQSKIPDVKAKFEEFGNKVSEAFSKISEKAEVAGGKVKEFFDKIKDTFSNRSFSKAIGILLSGGMVIAIHDISKALKAMSKFDLLGGMGKSIGGFFDTLKKKVNMKNVVEMAGAISMIALSLALLAKCDYKSIIAAGVAVGIIAVALSGLSTVLSVLGGKGKIGEFNSVAINMIGLSASLLLISGAIKALEDVDFDSVWKKVGLISVIMTELVAASAITGLFKGGSIGSALGIIAYAIGIKTVMNTLNEIELKNADEIRKSMDVLSFVVLAFSVAVSSARGVKMGAAFAIIAMAKAIGMVLDELSAFSDFPISKIESCLGNFIKLLGTFSLAIAAMSLIGKGAIQAGIGVLAMAGAMHLIISAVDRLAEEKSGNIASATLAVLGIMGIFALLTKMSSMSTKYSGKAGLAILGMASAMLLLTHSIKVLGQLDLASLAKGTISVSAIMGMMALIVNFAKGDYKKSVGVLITIAGVVSALATVVIIMSSIDPTGLGGATLSLLGITACLAILIKVSKTATLASLALVPITGVVALLALVLHGLCDLPTENAIASSASISVLLLSMSGALAIVSNIPILAALNAVGSLSIFVSAMTALVIAIGAIGKIPHVIELLDIGITVFRKIGEALGGIIGGFIGGIAEGLISVLPKIGLSLSMFAINVKPFLSTMSRIPEGTAKGATELSSAILAMTKDSLVQGILDFLGGGNTIERFGEQIEAFGPHIKKFSEDVANISPDNVTAAAEATSIIVDAINKLPASASWMDKIFGKKSLSDLAIQLKDYAPKLVEFSNSAVGISYENIQNACDATVAIIQSFSKLPRSGGSLQDWIGEKSLSALADQLNDYAPKLVVYSTTSKFIDEDNITKMNRITEGIINSFQNLPPAGGAWQKWIVGETTLTSLAEQLGTYAPHLVYYSTIAKQVSLESVEKASEATESIIRSFANLPATGGLLQELWSGEKSLTNLAEQIDVFAPHLVYFSQIARQVSLENVRKGCDATNSIVNTIHSLPESGGIKQWISGDANLDRIGKELSIFAPSLKSFYENTKEITYDGIRKASDSTSYLVNAISKLPTSGGIKSWFSGDANLDGIGKDLAKFSRGLLTYYTNFEDIDLNRLDSMTDSVVKIVNMVSDVTDIPADIMNNFGIDFEKGSESIVSAIQNISDEAYKAMNSHTGEYYSIGRFCMQGLANGIKNNSYLAVNAAKNASSAVYEASRKEVDVNSPSKKFMKLGYYSVKGFAIGFDKYSYLAEKSSKNLADVSIQTMQKSIKEVCSSINDVDEYVPSIKPVVDLTDVESGISTMKNMFSRNPTIDIGSTIQNARSIDLEKKNLVSANSEKVSNSATYQFTQNNYSPKALSRIDIYRQTNNQLRAIKGLVH